MTRVQVTRHHPAVPGDDLWEQLNPEAGRGSSGDWTADLGGLPISRGGCASESEALDALRDAHREAMQDPDYRALAIEISALPKAVQRAAHSAGRGDLRWRIESAATAIEALANAGRIVLRLDVRDYSFDGSFTEAPWSSYEPTGHHDVEAARDSALADLARDDVPGEWVLITWVS